MEDLNGCKVAYNTPTYKYHLHPDAPWDGNIYPAISPCSCDYFSPDVYIYYIIGQLFIHGAFGCMLFYFH